MSRLTVELYDAIGDVNPFLIITDDVPFVDLNDRNGADKAARVVVKRGSEYHPGDHVRLLDEVRSVDTDMITVDPLVAADVDLNAMGFADKAAGLDFQLNPTGQFRLRIDLHDQLGQPYPNLSLYDWQADPRALIDLNRLHFADKAARAVAVTGGAYHPADHVRLLDEVQLVDTDMITVDPLVAADVDLNAMGFADRTAGLAFELNPGASFDARVELFDTPRQALPNLSLYDWQSPSGFYDLNSLHFADKAAAVRVVGSRSHIITPIPPIPSQAAPPIRSGP